MRHFVGAVLAAVIIVAVGGMLDADVARPRDQWSPVRMVAEQVDIVLGPTKVTVEATFYLKNEGKAETVVVGYPRGVIEKSLNDFTVTADGEELTVDSQTGEPKNRSNKMGMGLRRSKGKPDGPVKRNYQFDGPYPEWKVFNVKFAKGQQRKLVVTYSVEPAEIKTKNGKLLAYTYTLKTGATWKGKIDKAVVEVKLNGLSAADIVTTTPSTKVAKDGVLRWIFKNFKPTQDIELMFRNGKSGTASR